MITIPANIVKDLRTQTNCPVGDCKKALVDANGNFDGAKKLLRERLGSLDVTKTDNGLEGLIAVWSYVYQDQGNRVDYVIAEIGTETDFAAKNPKVVSLCEKLVNDSLSQTDIIEELRAITGENIVLRRMNIETFSAQKFSPTQDVFAEIDIVCYIHHNRKVASIVIFSGKVDNEIKKDIAMHVAASVPSPVCIKPEDVPAELVENEREFLTKKAQATNKPQSIQDKIVEGGLSKFRSGLALLEQPFIKDPSKKVKDILPKGIDIVHILRWSVG